MDFLENSISPPSGFQIYPAIDLKSGRVVRLTQGRADRETVYFQDPLEPAWAWKSSGAKCLHVVDLDGAFQGVPKNRDVLQKLADLGFFLELGGGIRSEADIAHALALGINRVILGTKALEDPEFLKSAIGQFGPSVAVGIDAKDGKVATRGWVDVSEKDALEFASEVASLGAGAIIYTDISTDGMLEGPNLEAQKAMAEILPDSVDLIASGGVSRPHDVEALRELHATHQNLKGVIIGRALYEKTLDIREVLN